MKKLLSAVGVKMELKKADRKKAIEDARKLLKDGRYNSQEISELLNIPMELFVGETA